MKQDQTSNDVQTDRNSARKFQVAQQVLEQEIRSSTGGTKASLQQPKSFLQKFKQSLYDSIGNIVFGMEDGTVSIFGLVFGLANTANNSHTVFLAGATGAAAAAVSMMAGTYLDVKSTKAKAEADIEQERKNIQEKPKEEEQEIRGRLQAANFNEQEVSQIMAVLRNKPDAMLMFETAYELQIGESVNENPIVQGLWMFFADLIAASIPVIPFAFFALGTARIVSLIITAALVFVLGVSRAVITKTNIFSTVLETLLIAGAAGAAGVLIGKVIG